MIHQTAIIDPAAELGRNVRVGPYSTIGAHVRIGDDCEIHNHVTIGGHTTIGAACVFFPNCVIGLPPQDLKYAGETTELVIGEDNHFREFVTVHPGTRVGGGFTRIGDHNRFLIGVHLAHDMQIGNHVVISNHVQIAGHVHIEDCVTVGGQSGVHQFVTIGSHAMIGGQSHITMDVVPFMITMGFPAEVRAVNVNGMRRWKFAEEDIAAVVQAYRQLFAKRNNDPRTFRERLAYLEQHNGQQPHVAQLCQFLKRSLSVGRTGRYLESLRRDKPEDSGAFYDKPALRAAASDLTGGTS